MDILVMVIRKWNCDRDV